MKTMLFRKIETKLKDYYKNIDDRILIITGARQIGKSFIIRETAQAYFKNYIEINMQEDRDGDEYFKDVKTTKDFYLQIIHLTLTVSGVRMKLVKFALLLACGGLVPQIKRP